MECIGKRYFIILLSCLGFVFIMLLRLSSDMRVGQWMYIRHETYDSSISYQSSQLIFFTGQLTSSVGGIISNRYGGAVTFGVAMLLCAGINLLLGLLLRISLVLFVTARFFDSAIQALMYSSVADVWSRWTMLQHRSKYLSFTLVGYQLAEIIQVKLLPQENTPLKFIAIGAAIWGITWLLFVKNDPSQDENLSNAEKIILQERLKFLDEKSVALSQYPWLPILTSKSFWALNVAAFINGGGSVIAIETLQSLLSYYLESTHKMLTFVTSLSILIITMIVGCVVDYIRNKNIFTNNKIFVCISFVAQGIILIAFYSSFNYQIVMSSLYALILIFKTSADISIQTAAVDLSPRYASLLIGIQNSFNIFGLLCMNLLPVFLKDSLDFYNLSPFIIAVAIFYIIGALLYYIFGSTKLQSWNGTSKDGQELEERRNRMTVEE